MAEGGCGQCGHAHRLMTHVGTVECALCGLRASVATGLESATHFARWSDAELAEAIEAQRAAYAERVRFDALRESALRVKWEARWNAEERSFMRGRSGRA